MAKTRSSAPSQGSNRSTPEKQSQGQKRKAASTSGRDRKQQKTLEETAPDDSEMKAAAAKVEDEHHKEASGDADAPARDDTQEEKQSASHATEHSESSKHENGAVEHSEERSEKVPSSVLEKGIFYFLTRGRVGVDDPESVQDLARSYLVLRPLPKDAKLTDGPIDDLENNRLLALPKKVLPKSHRDQFMSFVEKASTTIQDLKDNFMKGSEYDTKTTGVRHTPPVTPLVEGVYAITSTGRTSHFAYIVTIPGELGEVQQDVGFRSKGSFVCSIKNPDQKGPAVAALPQSPDFPKEFMEEFRGLRWMAMQPKHLDYANAQILLIGEARDELGKAAEPSERDQKHDKETPGEEVEKLEEEDSHRTGQLSGDDSVFDDLGISAKDFPKVKSTW